MFEGKRITFKVDAQKMLESADTIEKVKEIAMMLKTLAIYDQDYEQAALFRDIEKNPEKFPIGG